MSATRPFLCGMGLARETSLGLLKMNAALTRLTDGARKKTAKYLTKAQAEAIVIKFASLCNTAMNRC